MNETIQGLETQLADFQKASETAYEQLQSKDISPDDFKAAKAKYEEATAKYDETKTKLEAANAEHDVARFREEAAKAVAARRQEVERFQLGALRPKTVAGAREAEKQHRKYEDSPQKFEDDANLVMAAWAGHNRNNPEFAPEAVAAARRLGVNLPQAELNLNRDLRYEKFAVQLMRRCGQNGIMAGVTDPADSRDGLFYGIFNRPPVYVQELAINTYSTNGILQAPVEVETTDHADDIIEDYLDNMMNRGSRSGEGQSLVNNTKMKAGQIRWSNYKAKSNSHPFTWESMRRNKYDLPARLPQLLGEELGQFTETWFTNGTGVNEPEGLVTFVTRGGLIADTTAADAIATEDIQSMITNSIDHKFFRSARRSIGWMMNRGTLTYLRLLKDLNGRPFFMIGEEFVNGIPQFTLEGFPVYLNYDFPNVIFNSAQTTQDLMTLAVFGDFSKFKVRYAFGSSIPVIIRDDVSGIQNMTTNFYAVQWVDSRGRDFGSPPLALLRNKSDG